MKVASSIQFSASGRFRKLRVDDVILSVERDTAVDRESIRALIREGVPVEVLGEELLALTQTSELVVERGEEMFLGLRKPVNLSFDGQVTVKIPEKITPCVVLSASPSEDRKVLVFAKGTEPARRAIELFEDLVERPHHLPSFIQEVKNVPGVLGVVGVVGRVVGTWGKFQLELV